VHEEAECLTVSTLHLQHQFDVGCRFGHGVTAFKHFLLQKVAGKINHFYKLEQKPPKRIPSLRGVAGAATSVARDSRRAARPGVSSFRSRNPPQGLTALAPPKRGLMAASYFSPHTVFSIGIFSHDRPDAVLLSDEIN
jgi:hypothetical protein